MSVTAAAKNENITFDCCLNTPYTKTTDSVLPSPKAGVFMLLFPNATSLFFVELRNTPEKVVCRTDFTRMHIPGITAPSIPPNLSLPKTNIKELSVPKARIQSLKIQFCSHKCLEQANPQKSGPFNPGTFFSGIDVAIEWPEALISQHKYTLMILRDAKHTFSAQLVEKKTDSFTSTDQKAASTKVAGKTPIIQDINIRDSTDRNSRTQKTNSTDTPSTPLLSLSSKLMNKMTAWRNSHQHATSKTIGRFGNALIRSIALVESAVATCFCALASLLSICSSKPLDYSKEWLKSSSFHIYSAWSK